MRRSIVLVVALMAVACSPSDAEAENTTTESVETSPKTTIAETTTTTLPPPFGLSSPRFANGETIPAEFTCDGPNINPPLNIVGVPESTQSLVLIVDDPDAPLGTWDHWVEFDIRAGPGPFDISQDTSALGVQGVNSWNLEGYMGPCPPAGDEAHTYNFTVYAIDDFLGLPPGVDSDAVRTAVDGHLIASVQLTGTFAR